MEALDVLYDIRVASVTVAVIIPLLLYWYSTRNHDFFKKRGIPYVKPFPFLGSHPLLERKNFEVVEEERYNKYGDLYGYFEGSNPVITVSKPELLRDILVKDFHIFSSRRKFNTGDPVLDKMLSVVNGEDWKRIRTIVSPTFSTGKIKRVMSIFQDCAKTLLQNFKMASVKGEPTNALRFYGAFTMDVIASSAFSTKIDSHNDPENQFVKRAKAAFQQGFGIRFLLFILMPGLLRKLGVAIFDPSNMNFFKQVTLDIVQERKKTGQTRNDFLQLLVDSATELAKEEKWEDSEEIIANYGDDESINHPVFKNTTSKRMSMDELVAQCVIFFLAGYHTTATTLGITTYLLALNEDVQEKVFKEIVDVLAENNGELKYESVQKMKYLDNVVSEVLRMYSPGIRLERSAEADYKLGDTGFTIPKGMIVGVPIFAIHRDQKFFPDPKKFDPDRFSAENREKQIPYSYLPFGAGPRNCVAMRFALLELKVCLIYVISAFQVKKCPETEIPLNFDNSTGLLAPRSITLRMLPRSDCPINS